MRELGGDLIPELERLGVSKVREMHALNEFYVNDAPRVSAWLLRKESEDQQESLSISRKALEISRSASRRALIAIALSATMAIYEIIKWYSSK